AVSLRARRLRGPRVTAAVTRPLARLPSRARPRAGTRQSPRITKPGRPGTEPTPAHNGSDVLPVPRGELLLCQVVGLLIRLCSYLITYRGHMHHHGTLGPVWHTPAEHRCVYAGRGDCAGCPPPLPEQVRRRHPYVGEQQL